MRVASTWCGRDDANRDTGTEAEAEVEMMAYSGELSHWTTELLPSSSKLSVQLFKSESDTGTRFGELDIGGMSMARNLDDRVPSPNWPCVSSTTQCSPKLIKSASDGPSSAVKNDTLSTHIGNVETPEG
jgi:hypothetical protein